MQIMTGTSSINAGVSSNHLKHAKHLDLPRNMYDVVQEMGRVNRDFKQTDSTYEVHLSFASVYQLYVSIMTNVDPLERKTLFCQAKEVLQFLVLPTMCYHSFMEDYFKSESKQKTDCSDKCSFCKGKYVMHIQADSTNHD